MSERTGDIVERPWEARLESLTEAVAAFLDAAEAMRAADPDRRFGDWSISDVLAHLVAWDAEAAQRFEEFLEAPVRDRDYDVEGFNAAAVAARRGQPWGALREEQAQTGARLMSVCERVSAADREREPRFVQWLEALIAHYGEHASLLQPPRAGPGE